MREPALTASNQESSHQETLSPQWWIRCMQGRGGQAEEVTTKLSVGEGRKVNGPGAASRVAECLPRSVVEQRDLRAVSTDRVQRRSLHIAANFVVSESKAARTEDRYVSPDWPSAENFAKRRLTEASEEH